MIATLVRYNSSEKCMLGWLNMDQKASFVTLEPPWRDNKKNLSCIPEGKYKCKRAIHYNRNGATYPAWEITNVPGNRTNVHIHRGNYPGDTTGCVLVGKDVSRDQGSIKNSTEAFANLMEVTKGVDEFDLYVTSIYANEPVFADLDMRKPADKDPTRVVESTFFEKLKWKVSNLYEAILAGIDLYKSKHKATTWEKVKEILKKVWKGVSMVLTAITMFKGGKK